MAVAPKIPYAFSERGRQVIGKMPKIEHFGIGNEGGVLTGLPDDLRGSGGGQGGDVRAGGYTQPGGVGGAGGGGFVVVSRGASVSTVTGKIKVNGANGVSGTTWDNVVGFTDCDSGSGAGGHPGGVLFVIDGPPSVGYPTLTAANIEAKHGLSPITTGEVRLEKEKVANSKLHRGTNYYSFFLGTGGEDAKLSTRDIVFLQKSRVPFPDYILSTTPGSLVFQQTTAPTNADCQTMAKRDLKTGDMWYDSDDGFKPHRYSGSAWVVVQDAAIAAATALAQTALANAATAQSTADGAIKTFYQTGAPSSGMAEGDIWFDTDDGNKIYTYRSGSWTVTQDSQIAQAINSAQNAQTTADGKAFVHYQASAPTGKTASDNGDIWIDTDDNNKMYVYAHPSWMLAQDWYAASLTANWAGVTGAGRPADGAQVNAPGLGCKRNYDTFTNANNGELYIHGYDSVGAAADVDGWINLDGAKLTVPRGVLATTLSAKRGYIVWDKLSRFSTANAGSPRFALAWLSNGVWRYDDNSAAVIFTPDDDHLVIGTMRTNSATPDGVIPRAVIWQDAKLLDVVGEAGATFGADFSTNVQNRYSNYLYRNSGDLTELDDIVQRINGAGRAANSLLFRSRNTWGVDIGKSSYTTITSSDAGSTANINISAFSVYYDYGTKSYPSGTLTGKTFGATYYVYMSDPNGDGTGVTYGTDTFANIMSAGPDIVYLGKIVCVNDGGNGGVPPDECVAATMWVDECRQIRDVIAGDFIECPNTDFSGTEMRQVVSNPISIQPCYRLITQSGAEIECSETTPFRSPDGAIIFATEMLNQMAWTEKENGEFGWERIVECYSIGEQPICKTNVGNWYLLAGKNGKRRIASHNINNKP